jgi:predicted GNAT family acetyltransferase
MAAERPGITVRDNPGSLSYDALLGGEVVGAIVYERSGSRIVFLHTVVDPQCRRRGIGTALVARALDDVRAQGLTLTNYCGFVTDFIAAHPAYAALLDAEHPGRPHRG